MSQHPPLWLAGEARSRRPPNLPRLFNPPRRRQLRYRIGTRSSFRTTMFSSLYSEQLFTSDAAPVGMARDAESNWVMALFSVWAEVGDILSFYQERWVQEGYIRTAAQEVSVIQLALSVGYEPRPPASGNARLALLLDELQSLPSRLVLPARSRIDSAPKDESPPQTFEVFEKALAQRPFNLIDPIKARESTSARTVVAANTTLLRLMGGPLTPGDGLLIRTRPATDEGKKATPPDDVDDHFRIVAATEPVAGQPQEIQVSFSEPLYFANTAVSSTEIPDSAAEAKPAVPAQTAQTTQIAPGSPLAHYDPGSLEVLETFVLRRQSRLFGATAPEWSQLPLETQRRFRPLQGGVLLGPVGGPFEPINKALPEVELKALLFADKTLLAGSSTGLFRRPPGTDSEWQTSSRGLQQTDILCLAADGRQAVLAGTTAGGVYRSTDGGRVWERLGQTATSPGLVGTLVGNLVDTSRGGPLPTVAVRALLSLEIDGDPHLLAGSDSGIHLSTNRGASWIAAGRGLPGFDAKVGTAGAQVYNFAALDDGRYIYAATSAGVYESSDHGRRWQPKNVGLPGTHPITEASKTTITSLALVVDPRQGRPLLFAGSAVGLWTSDNRGSSWSLVGVEKPSTPQITALAVVENPSTLERTLFAGTTQGIFTSLDYGKTWQRVPLGPSTQDPVSSIAIGEPGLAMAAPFAGFEADEWPGFYMQEGQIDLESSVPGLVPGSEIVLQPAAGAIEALEIEAVREVDRQDFTLTARVTRLFVSRSIDLSRFDLRGTVAWVRSEPRRAVTTAPWDLKGQTSRILQQLQALDVDREIIVEAENLPWAELLPLDFASHGFSGSAMGLGDVHGNLISLTHARLSSLGLQEIYTVDQLSSGLQSLLTGLSQLEEETEKIIVAVNAGQAPAGAETFPLLLTELKDGRPSIALTSPQAPAAQPSPGPASPPTSPSSAATHSAGDPGSAGGRSEALASPIPLAKAIQEALDALLGKSTSDEDPGSPPTANQQSSPSLRIYGNVANVVEGSTVSEVLGSGEPTHLNATFALSRPIAYELVDGILQPSLVIHVSNQRWRLVPTLFGRQPDERVYSLARNFHGQDIVIFGDGTFGALLPEGIDNIVATYRTGTLGNAVSAKALTLLQSRPLGLGQIWNPYAGTPGAAGESASNIRLRAPLGTRSLGRVVAQNDYQDFTLEYPGVSKARVFDIETQSGPWIQVTISFEGDPGRRDESETALQLASITSAIAGARDSHSPFLVQHFVAKPVHFKAVVELDPDPTTKEEWLDLESLLRQGLEQRFGFDHQDFGRPLAASEVVRNLQSHETVRSVLLLDFSTPNDVTNNNVPALDRAVFAKPARTPTGRARDIVAAELVWLITGPESTLQRLSDVDPSTLPDGAWEGES